MLLEKKRIGWKSGKQGKKLVLHGYEMKKWFRLLEGLKNEIWGYVGKKSLAIYLLKIWNII